MSSLEVELQFKNTWREKPTSKTGVYYKWHYPWRASINLHCDLLIIFLISCAFSRWFWAKFSYFKIPWI